MAQGDQSVQVVVFDPHVAVRAGLRVLLEGPSVRIVGETGLQDEFYGMITAGSQRVYILGFSVAAVPECVAMIEGVLQRDGDAQILVYATYEAPELVSEIYEAGAKGYVLKTADPEVLRNGVVRVADGEHYFMPGMADQIALYHTTGITQQHPRTLLSPEELKIFIMLANKTPIPQIAGSLSISEKSVRNRAVTIRHKLSISRDNFTKHARYHKLI